MTVALNLPDDLARKLLDMPEDARGVFVSDALRFFMAHKAEIQRNNEEALADDVTAQWISFLAENARPTEPTEIVFEPGCRFDSGVSCVRFQAKHGKRIVWCSITQNTLIDVFGAQYDKQSCISAFEQNRAQIEAEARDCIERGFDRVILRDTDFPKRKPS